PNAVRDDSLNAMKEYGKKQAFNFTYLKDEDGQVATSYGALRTPECFVIDADRKIIYMGAFDDNSNADRVNVSYVDEVIAAALKGEAPEVRETPPVGCLIRQRRRR
ncbi:MAG: redoxin domain-containing protein, partial [Planctomycetota bacterium]|nr:redoxin domain-containing protein [Planctomycetota bacterium]